MMSSDEDVFVRVAVRAIVAAGVTGLLVLLFQGRAWADTPEELAAQLTPAPGEGVTPLDRAEEILQADRRERWMRLYEAVVETGFRMWGSSSPRRVLSGARDIAGELWEWRDRSSAEDEALNWLELELQTNAGDPDAIELYGKLRRRELEALVDRGLERADAAIEARQPLLAAVHLQNVLDLQPDSEEALSLLDRLDELELAPTLESDVLSDSLASLAIEPWEAPLAAALLSGDYAEVLERAPESPSGRYAASVAQYLAGSPEAAIGTWEDLGERPDAVGRLAHAWVEREDINVVAAFEREARAYKVRRVLGFVGGSELADEGIGLSTDVLRAWQQSITPLNVAVSMPARLYRGWRPDGEALRMAALEYIARLPQGERAEEAQAWLHEVAPQAEPIESVPSSTGEGFVLPPPSTMYARLSPSPVVVTRSVLDSVFVSDAGALRDALGSSHSVVLEARSDLLPDQGLAPERARRFLTELAFALEQGELDAVGYGTAATLEGIRRLERALADGAALTAEPAEYGSTEIWGTLTRAYVDGEYETVGALTLSRGKDELRAARHFGRGALSCPERSFCVDRALPVRSTLYTRLDPDDALQVALAAEFQGAHVSMSMIEGTPRASIVLPVGRWLGLGSWLPLAAQVGIAADSVYVGPTFAR